MHKSLVDINFFLSFILSSANYIGGDYKRKYICFFPEYFRRKKKLFISVLFEKISDISL